MSFLGALSVGELNSPRVAPLDAGCFNKYLSLLSQEFPDEVLIILIDNAPGHTSHEIEFPDNIILFFQPPYCPEVNPSERFWEYLKQDLGWELF